MRIQWIAVAALALASFSTSAQQAAPTPDVSPDIGFASVKEALETLRAKPGVQVQITKPDSWIIITEPGNIQWSFAPETHKAYPAVSRREVKVDAGGDVKIETRIRCESDKSECDKLTEEFIALNERIRQSIRARLQQQAR
ncbi:hypothetical protein IP84_11645 [beta proteobacterium AAP99]|nr:hypothetical protein IP84_11645 [beta proteobacterium AAP99]